MKKFLYNFINNLCLALGIGLFSFIVIVLLLALPFYVGTHGYPIMGGIIFFIVFIILCTIVQILEDEKTEEVRKKKGRNFTA